MRTSSMPKHWMSAIVPSESFEPDGSSAIAFCCARDCFCRDVERSIPRDLFEPPPSFRTDAAQG